MGSLLSLLVPLALRLIGAWLDKQENAAEAQKSFIDFVEKASSTLQGSAKVKQSFDAQKDRLQKMRDELNKPPEVQNGNNPPPNPNGSSNP